MIFIIFDIFLDEFHFQQMPFFITEKGLKYVFTELYYDFEVNIIKYFLKL